MACRIKFDCVGLQVYKLGLKNYLYLRFCSVALNNLHTNSSHKGMERNGSEAQANEPVEQLVIFIMMSYVFLLGGGFCHICYNRSFEEQRSKASKRTMIVKSRLAY